MHRCRETIGAIAAPLAKARGELTKPEKSLGGPSRRPYEAGGRSQLPLRLITPRWPAGSRSSANASASMRSPRCRPLPLTGPRPNSAHNPAGARLRRVDLVGLAGLPASETAPHRMGTADRNRINLRPPLGAARAGRHRRGG
jgi:hypothetical protein